MTFVKTFKGYEDRISELDDAVNGWVLRHAHSIEVLDVKAVMAHEPGGRSGMGDLVYCLLYKASQPINEPEWRPPAGFED